MIETIIAVILGLICVYLILNRLSLIKKCESSIYDHETELTKLNQNMEESIEAKSKALAKSEELRLKVISQLETKQHHFEKLEHDLDTSHKLFGIQLKEKQALEVKFVQLRQHYDAIVTSVKLPREFISKKSNLEKRLKNVG